MPRSELDVPKKVVEPALFFAIPRSVLHESRYAHEGNPDCIAEG